MFCYFYILCKYWRKHLRTAFALLFSGLLLTAIITTVFLFIREGINQEVELWYDSFGKYDLILSVSDDLKSELIPADADCIHETVTVPGKVDFYGNECAYGYTTEMGYNLLHIPMVSGSLPVSENEAAVAQSLLESVGYLGKSGDSITINGKQYILKGIIGEGYYRRALCENVEYLEGYGRLSLFPLYMSESRQTLPRQATLLICTQAKALQHTTKKIIITFSAFPKGSLLQSLKKAIRREVMMPVCIIIQTPTEKILRVNSILPTQIHSG